MARKKKPPVMSRAWLITWEDDPSSPQIACILPSNRPVKVIEALMQQLFLERKYTPRERFYYARKSGEAPTPRWSTHNGIPHKELSLDDAGREWLYGRRVSKLTFVFNDDETKEIASWTEPDQMRWKDEATGALEIAVAGKRREVMRSRF